MAGNTKISALPAGAPAQGTDVIPVDRAGVNVALRVSDVLATSTSIPVSALVSVEGNGTKVQLTSQGSTTSTDVVTYDASGNVQDSGSSLSNTIEGVNNSILSGPVDTGGNPNYASVATASTVATLTVNGNVTNLAMYIAGQYQIVADQLLTVVLNNGGASAPQANFVYLRKRAGIVQLQSTDIGVTTNAPVFGNNQTAPATTNASSSNPLYWFDPTVNLWKKATANNSTFTADPIIPLCVVVVDNSGNSLGIGYWGPRWTPWKVMEYCGQGTDGSLNVQTGTTTKDGWFNFSSLVVSGGILTHTAITNAGNSSGLFAYSQSPIVVVNSAVVKADGLGAQIRGGATGVGAAGISGGFAGPGGGGGGSGTTSAAGGGGGTRVVLQATAGTGAGTAGTASPSGGGNATAGPTSIPPIFSSPIILMGASGGAGAGDGTNAGGSGGAGGGVIFLVAPGILASSGTTISANGNTGGNGVAGNAAGGGGGGGGTVSIHAGYISTSTATVTAALGGGGNKAGAGSGTAGGNGAAGYVQQIRIF